MGLNPQAPAFFPSQNPQPVGESFFYLSTSLHLPFPSEHRFISPPTASPFIPCSFPEVEPSYVFYVAKEANPLEALKETQKLVAEKVDARGVSKQRFFSAIIGCGRRMEGRRGKGKGGEVDNRCGLKNGRFYKDRHIQAQNLENVRAFPRKKPFHPVVPVRFDGEDTTIMIRNIPNKYSREMLLKFLDNHCLVENQKVKEANDEQKGGNYMVSAFDLVYLPIDFETGLNKGYAFVNFTNPMGAWKFHSATNNKKWDLFQSDKICDVAVARLQGKEKLQRHFESLNLLCESKEVLPVCFSPPRDGTLKEGGSIRTLGKLTKLSCKKKGSHTTQQLQDGGL